MKPDTTLRPLMIVDDSENDAALLKYSLEAIGVQNPIRHFRSANDAFKFLKPHLPPAKTTESLPTVMFLDVNMPDFSGFDLLMWARQQPTFLPMKIFVVSGANEPSDAQIASTFGADRYLRKFPELDELAELIGDICTLQPAASGRTPPFEGGPRF
jgi:CheY-like chemotaxis protein